MLVNVAMGIFWGSVFLLFYTLAGYFLLLELISVFFRKSNPMEPLGSECPSVTMIIPAYNEEASILEKIANCRELEYPEGKLDFIVVSDASSDRTDRRVQEASRTFSALTFLRVEGRKGKTACQNLAVIHAKGEILVFSDADSMYLPDAIRKLVRNYTDPAVGGVSGCYSYINPSNSSVGKSTITFWEYENRIKRCQSRIRTLTGASGCIYSIRRNLYEMLPPYISSDIIEPLTVVRKGYVIRFEEEAMAVELTTSRPKQEFGMRVRVVTGGIIGLLHVKEMLNPIRHPWIAFQLISHKIFRWLMPLFIAAIYISSVLLKEKSPLYIAVIVVMTIFLFAAVFGWILDYKGKSNRILSIPLFFVIGNAAILVAIVKACFGYKAAIWETNRARPAG